MARKQISFHEELPKWSLFLAWWSAIRLRICFIFKYLSDGRLRSCNVPSGNISEEFLDVFSDVLWTFIVNLHCTYSLHVLCMLCSQTSRFARCELSFIIPIPLLNLGPEIVLLQSLSDYRSKCPNWRHYRRTLSFLGFRPQICWGRTNSLLEVSPVRNRGTVTTSLMEIR